MNKNIAKTQLLDLYKIAISDGIIDKNEYRFMLDIGRNYGLEENEILDIINKNIDFEMQEAISFNERMQHLFQMLFLMKIDGKVKASEIQTLKNIALYLGINLNMTEELINIIQKHKQNNVPVSEMIEIVKLHLN